MKLQIGLKVNCMSTARVFKIFDTGELKTDIDIIDSKFERPKILKIGVYLVLKCSTVAANNLFKIN